MDIKEMLKDKIEEVVDKLKSDKDLLNKFNANPAKTLEEILGVDLPDDQINALVDGVKAKLNLDKLGSALGGLFGKK